MKLPQTVDHWIDFRKIIAEISIKPENKMALVPLLATKYTGAVSAVLIAAYSCRDME